MQNKYPLWKNILLIVIALIGFLYAIPNIYTEEPVIQVSAEQIANDAGLQQQIQTMLEQSKVPFTSMQTSSTGVEVRFASTDAQLIAKDVIKQGLGNNYTVALNLAASMPAWLSAIGAEPMKQGLDLRGGVHFLLEVDVDSVVARRYEGLLKSIGRELREKGIR